VLGYSIKLSDEKLISHTFYGGTEELAEEMKTLKEINKGNKFLHEIITS